MMRLYKFHGIFPSGGVITLFASEVHNMAALLGFIFRDGIRPHIPHIVLSLQNLQVGEIFEMPVTEIDDCYIMLVEIEGDLR